MANGCSHRAPFCFVRDPCCSLSTVCVQGIYLVADDADSADAWVDALVLCQHLVATRCSEALEEALVPAPTRRSKHATGTAG